MNLHTKRHIHIDVTGAVNHPKDFVGVITVDGKTLTDVKEIKSFFQELLAEGKECIPCGECNNFDYLAGCRGHIVADPLEDINLVDRNYSYFSREFEKAQDTNNEFVPIKEYQAYLLGLKKGKDIIDNAPRVEFAIVQCQHCQFSEKLPTSRICTKFGTPLTPFYVKDDFYCACSKEREESNDE